MRKILLALLTAAVLTAVWADASRAAVADNVIRMHVVANSDSDADQAYKLEVKDRVIKLVSGLTAGAADSNQAAEIIEENLELIHQTAGENTRVALSVRSFPSKDYGLFALPAGSYNALTVTIGAGKGENWWCVIFPPLCASVTEDEFVQAAQQAGLSDDEIAFITGDGEETVVIRFKTLEILQKLFNWP